MDFGFSEEEKAFRKEVREFLCQELNPEGEGWTPRERFRPEFSRKLGEKGWLGVAWPKEYGGLGRSHMQHLIFGEEMLYHRAPAGAHVLGQNMVGPTLIAVGSEEQKREFLPKILRGEVTFCLGYTEPNAGSDLASMETKAVAEGDDFIINGQKRFTSFAGEADFCWLAARTDPNAPKKHRGISIFIVDMKTPGITIGKLDTMWDYMQYEVFFDNVRVPKSALVGELNQGWYYMTTALDHERVFIGAMVEEHRRLFNDLVQYANETHRNGKPLSKDPLIRQKLAQLAIELEVGRLFAYRVAWQLSKGIVPFSEASMTKVFTTELERRLANTATQLLGLHSQLRREPRAPFKGFIEWEYRFSLMQGVGSSNEIQRMIIAIAGLGLPR